MKKQIILILSVLVSSFSFAQKMHEKDIPSAVVSAFKTKFPQAGKTTWELEKPNEYEVNFKINNQEASANFDHTGKWLETEMELKSSKLPVAIQDVLRKNFAGYSIEETSKIESLKEGNVFEAEVKKGSEHFDLLLSADGKVLSKTKIKGKEKKD